MKVVLWAKTEKGTDPKGQEGPPTVVLFKKGMVPTSRGPVEAEDRVVVLHGMKLPPQLEGKAVEAEISTEISGLGTKFAVVLQETQDKPDEPVLAKVQEKMTAEQKREKGKHFGMGMRGGGQIVGNVKKPSPGMPPAPQGTTAQPGAGMRNTARRKQRGGPNQGMRSFSRTPKRKTKKED